MKYLVLLTIALVGCRGEYHPAYVDNRVPSFQSYQFGFQDIPNGITKIQAKILALGSYSEYNANQSRWTPSKQGLYYIDEQLWIEGEYPEPVLIVSLDLNLNQQPYINYSNTVIVPLNQTIRNKFSINGLICFDGKVDYTEVWVTTSQGINRVVSEQSQFEGVYIGPCPGTPTRLE